MINGVIDQVINYLESKQSLNLFTTFSVDILKEDDNALAIRNAPSSPGSRFLNKSRDDVISFQVLVKHSSQSTAVNVINGISTELESLDKNKLSMNNFISCQVYTYPTFVEKTDRGSFIYTALFHFTLNQ